MKDKELDEIAFNSNGRYFYPETVKDLLAWKDKAVKEARIEGATKMMDLYTKYSKGIEWYGWDYGEKDAQELLKELQQ